MDKLALRIPSKPQYISTLRLMTASVANGMNFDIESVEDLRVCVSEAVNYLLPDNDELEVIFGVYENRLEITINAEWAKADQENELYRLILETLLDEVNYEEGSIILVKKRLN